MLARAHVSTALVVALSIGVPRIAAAQTTQPDLSGTWHDGSGGEATFEKVSASRYRVLWTDASGQPVRGTATADGFKVSVQLDNGVGFTQKVVDAVTGETTTDTKPSGSAYGYSNQASDPYERLGLMKNDGGAVGNGTELRRVKPGATSTQRDDAYGSRSQIAAVVGEVKDALGNRDGIVGNESDPAGDTDHMPLFSTQPLLDRIRLWAQPGLSTKDEKKLLTDFVASREKAWGEPVTDLPADALPNMSLFRAEKAAELTRFGRKPDEVTEGFVNASGSVAGQKIDPRNIFWQRWKPIGTPNGKVVVVSPGFQETGREFLEQANELDKQGYDVILMDHQWSGYTVPTGQPGMLKRAEATVEGWIFGANAKRSVLDDAGGIDRGFGVARDVAAMAANANQVANRDYAKVPGHGVILLGNSMGAGPGVLGALTLNDAGLMKLDGPPMPKGLDAVLEAPFIQMTPSKLNEAVSAVAHVPGVNSIEVPSSGLPVLTHDDAAGAKFGTHAASDDVGAQLHSMIAANADIAAIRKLVDDGKGPAGRIYVIHGDKDPLADPAGSKWLVSKLGGRGKLDLISANDHVLEESPSEQNHILDGMKWLTGR